LICSKKSKRIFRQSSSRLTTNTRFVLLKSTRSIIFSSLSAASVFAAPFATPDAEIAVLLIRAAGGVPVMAHPLAARRGRVVSDDVIAELAAAGLAGLEVDHRDHDEGERAHLRALAADLGLFTTGSSDYHGTGKVNRIGENLTAPEVLEQIEALGTGSAVVRP